MCKQTLFWEKVDRSGLMKFILFTFLIFPRDIKIWEILNANFSL